MMELIKDRSILDYLYKKGRLTKQTVTLRKLGLSFLADYVSDHFLKGIEPFHSDWSQHDHDLYYATHCTESRDPKSDILLQIIDKKNNELFVADITIEIDKSPLNKTFYELSYRIKLKDNINKKESILLEKIGASYRITSDYPHIKTDFKLKDAICYT